MDDLLAFFSKWTPGGVGIWTLVIMALIAWWQGLPKLLDAITNRQSKIEERMGQLLADATTRFDRQIAEADRRLDECTKRHQQMEEHYERRIAAMQGEIDGLHDLVAGLKKQRVAVQVSAIRNAPDAISSPVIEDMVQSLEAKGFGA